MFSTNQGFAGLLNRPPFFSPVPLALANVKDPHLMSAVGVFRAAVMAPLFALVVAMSVE